MSAPPGEEWPAHAASDPPQAFVCGTVLERSKSLLQDSHQQGEKMIMLVKTPGSQKGSPAAPQQHQKKEERGGGGQGGGGTEKVSASEGDVGGDGAKSEIKVERRCGHG